MQFFIAISRNTESKSYMLSLTECVWDFLNNALWDTHIHALSGLHLLEKGKTTHQPGISYYHEFINSVKLELNPNLALVVRFFLE